MYFPSKDIILFYPPSRIRWGGIGTNNLDPILVSDISINSQMQDNNDFLVFSTFFGGYLTDVAYDMVLDSASNIIIAGWTTSPNFPTTIGAYNQTHSGNQDLFVSKLSADGSTPLFSTFIGSTDNPSQGGASPSLILDSADNIIIVASTEHSNFPTTDSVYDETHNGDHDVVITKLFADGSNLMFSTFLGGADKDRVSSVARDTANNIYITGCTKSSDFPTTPGAYNNVHNGGLDFFITKLSADGSHLVYSTLLGGSEHEAYPRLALDGQNNVIVAGGTSSTNFPTTPNALNLSSSGGSGSNWEGYWTFKDVVVSQLSANGSNLLYSTYLSGTGNEVVTAMTLDGAGDIIIGGSTGSDDFPVTTNVYDSSYNGGTHPDFLVSDIFVMKLALDDSTLLFSTYLGGNFSAEFCRDLTLDSLGNLYLTGITGSTDFPITSNAFDNEYLGIEGDGFISILFTNGSKLLYSSFLGGFSKDDVFSIQRDDMGNIYMAGNTASFDLTVKNALDSTYNGNGDVFVTMISLDLDNDGLSDSEENNLGTHFLNPDTDNDGILDAVEISLGLDPTNPDTDEDGLTDGQEVDTLGTNATNIDTDGDGLDDFSEIFIWKTLPNNTDTDGDWIRDGDEIRLGLSPTNNDLIFFIGIPIALGLGILTYRYRKQIRRKVRQTWLRQAGMLQPREKDIIAYAKKVKEFVDTSDRTENDVEKDRK
ncbi:MAG: SBBP repeat-containing protein [Candidatus Hermodarchaeota archaeon]